MAIADYQVIVNWKPPNTEIIGTFETGLDDWVPASGVQIDLSTTKVLEGTYSAEFRNALTNTLIFDDPDTPFDTGVFGSDVAPAEGLLATRLVTGLTVGENYTVGAWGYVTAGTRHLKLDISGTAQYTSETNKYDLWTYLECGFTATASTETIELSTLPGTNNVSTLFVDNITISVAGEDVTCYVLGNNGSIDFKEGRDQARSLSSIAPSETSLELLNTDRRFSPNNPSSVLNGRSPSGVPMQIRAYYEGRYYILYNGFIDSYIINPTLPDFSILELTSFDQLGRMGSQEISTEVYAGKRTGELINQVLNEVEWPEGKRIIDPGATVVQWWWEEGTTALEAVTKLVASEGIPAFVYIDDLGNFVFRDRHHRYLDPDSTEIVAGFTCRDPDFTA